MESTTLLHESLDTFESNKQACLSFLDHAIQILKAFEEDFPSDLGINDEDPFINSHRLIKARSRIEDANLKILIAGQFKTGKSTIINALLGKNILPAYSTPCTAVITEINYADTPRAELVFKPNLTTVPDDLCPKALEHINAHKPTVPDLILEGETLESELEDFLVIPANGKEQRDAVAESPYALCRLFWPLDLCRNNVEIIDSPGLNEAAARDKTTMDYVPKATANPMPILTGMLSVWAIPRLSFSSTASIKSTTTANANACATMSLLILNCKKKPGILDATACSLFPATRHSQPGKKTTKKRLQSPASMSLKQHWHIVLLSNG